MDVVEPRDVIHAGMLRAASLAANLAEEALRTTFKSGARAGAEPPSVVAPAAGTLPRATMPPGAWGLSAPGGFTERLRAEALPVRSIPDVAAVGRALSPREQRVSKVPAPRSRASVTPARPSLSAIARNAAGRQGASSAGGAAAASPA
ncbi:MAG: hypothetical protein ACRDWE_08560, partial [Acidimicrobiales bacterium]